MDEELVSSSLESVLRQLPALELRGCRIASFQAVRATCLRVRMVRTFWNHLTTRERRALLYLLCVKSGGPSQARWWCQHSYAQALETIQLILSHLCSEEETRTLGTKTERKRILVGRACSACLTRIFVAHGFFQKARNGDANLARGRIGSHG